MCGVIGLVFEEQSDELGELAARLLKMLEYRGYDSTGALFQTKDDRTVLKKDVGAPSRVTKDLAIDREKGQVFCGQVRWATFGSVSKENAQPHEARCKIHFYGAHNGNVTNCDQLKDWLKSEGHDVKSDNDGEMVVHTVEHFFAKALQGKDANEFKARREALRQAVVEASKKIVGSFAAVVFDPKTQLMAAIKAGSSLYIGLGHDETYGAFVIASSDLGSVLSLTKILLPISENEFAVTTYDNTSLFDIKSGKPIERKQTRTLLNVADTQLQAPYSYFMEQEIHTQVAASRKLIRLYSGQAPIFDFLRQVRSREPKILDSIRTMILELASVAHVTESKQNYQKIMTAPEVKRLAVMIKDARIDLGCDEYSSTMAGYLDEVRKSEPKIAAESEMALRTIDAVFELADSENIARRVDEFVGECVRAKTEGRSVYVIACGTSFHASKTATLFFDEIAEMPFVPLLPGEFRAQYNHSISDGDVIVGVSQSGETKDLIDIFNQVSAGGKKITMISIVNNVNSTLAQEKAKFFIPLLCGPEIAVPATKSFMNQLILMYFLALKVMDARKSKGHRLDEQKCRRVWANLFKIPGLIEETLKNCEASADRIASDLYLAPSMHILATRMLGIAQEGSLKIREVVLNHTQGYEGSEFKHGPNTILGINTVFGLDSIRAILKTFSDAVMTVLDTQEGRLIGGRGVHRLFHAVAEYAFNDAPPHDLNEKEKALFDRIFAERNFFQSLYRNYPLIFVTGPSERDVNLTVSQINTHKIRGADVYILAEENDALRKAAVLSVDGNRTNKSGYVTLPATGDDLLPVFSSTVVLQMLALKMSIRKKNLLNRLEIRDHGVHPDAPKNVSKSITVD